MVLKSDSNNGASTRSLCGAHLGGWDVFFTGAWEPGKGVYLQFSHVRTGVSSVQDLLRVSG